MAIGMLMKERPTFSLTIGDFKAEGLRETGKLGPITELSGEYGVLYVCLKKDRDSFAGLFSNLFADPLKSDEEVVVVAGSEMYLHGIASALADSKKA